MCIPGQLNIALNKECQQSSTYSERVLEFGPQLAVDGNTNIKHHEGGTCTHTPINQPPYW